jgi:hypothetical protein
MIYAAIQFTADQGNVHGCVCVYSDCCFKSEVQFNYFSISMFPVNFYSFRFGVCSFIILGDTNVLSANALSKMCKLLLHFFRFPFTTYVCWLAGCCISQQLQRQHYSLILKVFIGNNELFFVVTFSYYRSVFENLPENFLGFISLVYGCCKLGISEEVLPNTSNNFM